MAYLKCPEDIHKAVKIEAAKRGIEMQEATTEAVRLWLSPPAVPKPEHPSPVNITCPVCSSVLSVGPGEGSSHPPIGVVQEGVLKPEQPSLSAAERALIERGIGRISDVELRWLQKTLYVFRKGPLRTVAALMTNLDTFEEHTEVMAKEARNGTEDASDDRDAEIERIEQIMDEEEALRRSPRETPKSRGSVGKRPRKRAS